MPVKKIIIDGVIGKNEGEISSHFVKSQLPANGTDPIEISIHSEGGSVFEGFAIHDALKAYEGHKKCLVASSAFSIASFIPMACDEVEITPNGYMMLHAPYSEGAGAMNASELRGAAVLLEQMEADMVSAYCEKTGRKPEDFAAILSKDTFLNAEQCVAYGLADKITSAPVKGRMFAKANSMPHGIVKALFGAGPSGDNREPTRENTMSESQSPVAATVKQIKAAFPLAKADFVIRCMEQEMPMEKVYEAAADEAMTENQALVARIAALETEMSALKAAVPSAPLPSHTPDVEEEQSKAKASAKSGVKPIAKASTVPVASAKARWNEAISAKVASGLDRMKAAREVNKEQPELREQMLEEANS